MTAIEPGALEPGALEPETEYVTREGIEFKLVSETPDYAVLFENVNGTWENIAEGPPKFLKKVHIPAEVKSRSALSEAEREAFNKRVFTPKEVEALANLLYELSGKDMDRLRTAAQGWTAHFKLVGQARADFLRKLQIPERKNS
jgi:hypothetical protein